MFKYHPASMSNTFVTVHVKSEPNVPYNDRLFYILWLCAIHVKIFKLVFFRTTPSDFYKQNMLQSHLTSCHFTRRLFTMKNAKSLWRKKTHPVKPKISFHVNHAHLFVTNCVPTTVHKRNFDSGFRERMWNTHQKIHNPHEPFFSSFGRLNKGKKWGLLPPHPVASKRRQQCQVQVLLPFLV